MGNIDDLHRWKNYLQKISACFVLFIFAAGTAGCCESASFQPPLKRAKAKVEYKSEMVNLIGDIHRYVKEKQPTFELMGNNGLELFLPQVGYGKQEAQRFIANVDGIIMEEYYYGWEMKDDERTPASTQREISERLQLPMQNGIPVLNIDYCETPSKMRRSYAVGKDAGFVTFAASSRQLDVIPKYPIPIFAENSKNIYSLKDIQNFLVLLNPEKFRNKQTYLDTLGQTNYDLLIIDMTFNGDPLSKEDVKSLKHKANGGQRIVFAYVSVGEAEDYRPYWKEEWHNKPPVWIAEENEDWEGNFKVKYWTKEWRQILFGTPESSFDVALDAGFDGAFMDVIDAFNYFEGK